MVLLFFVGLLNIGRKRKNSEVGVPMVKGCLGNLRMTFRERSYRLIVADMKRPYPVGKGKDKPADENGQFAWKSSKHLILGLGSNCFLKD